MTRARLGAYAAWQVRDYALHRGVPTLIVGALLLLQVVVLTAEMGRNVPQGEMAPVIAALLEPFALIGALIAINGLISHDRRQGFFRFLFAKPVSIPRYYVQGFLVHGGGFVLASAIFLIGVWAVSGMSSPARTVLYPAVYYVLLGGLGFLFSAALRSEWVLIAATLALTALARSRWADDPGVLGWAVRWLLPPFHVMDEVRTSLVGGGAPDWWTILWPVSYGGLAVIAGVIILRRRALGR